MRRNRKFIVLLLVFMILMTTTNIFAVRHERRDIPLKGIIVNDHIVYSDVYPYIKNDRTYVPIRFIAEELGYDVDWNGKIRQVTMTEGSTKVQLTIGTDEMLINGKVIKIDAPAEIRDDRTFVPLRAIVEAFGQKVDFSNNYRTVYIGDEPKYNEFYNVVYYYEGHDPVISDYTINIVNYNINVNGKITRYESVDNMLYYIFDNFEHYKHTGHSDLKVRDYDPRANETANTSSIVPKDKQLKDEYYIENERGSIVGSWYGTTKTINTNDYYDVYWHIEKIGDNKYLYNKRSIKDNGSELVTEGYISIKSNGNISFERSHKTTLATGDFNRTWYAVSGEFNFNGLDYMYEISDPKVNMTKY